MINGKELMIGDYVDVSGHGNPIEVGIIRDIYEIYGEGYEINIRLKDCDGIFAGNEISPIELTEEFFLKNGFAELYADNHIARLYNRDKGLIVIFYPPDNCFRCGTDKIVIDYVHEFQRYLRLVNLPGYANRLKI